MRDHVLITGSAGLVGRALRNALEKRGVAVRELDLRAPAGACGDVRDAAAVQSALAGCRGVIHLAAVSRVIWGEQDPERCWSTNVDGLQIVMREAMRAGAWLVFASSREVYGQPGTLPASEDAPLQPVNVYGRSKVAGEAIVARAAAEGLPACTVRLSNVYGCTADHADRVVPAFARAAVLGHPLRVDGPGHTFDFTHVDDTVRGLVALIDHLDGGGGPLPPIHLLTGRPTTLGELAALAVELGGGRSAIVEAPPRSYDVARFYGDPDRAERLLGWRAGVTLRAGLSKLINDFRGDVS